MLPYSLLLNFKNCFHFSDLPFFLCLTFLLKYSNGNEDAKRLYDDLLTNYNRHKRPAESPLEPITIRLKLRLSQIIDVHEIDQIMTCSVWVKQVWTDRKLKWNPEDYGGVSVLYVPYEMIWVPDVSDIYSYVLHLFLSLDRAIQQVCEHSPIKRCIRLFTKF